MKHLGKHLRHKKYIFPWRVGNHFRLLVDADVFFPAMLDVINQASISICFELYLIKSGKVASSFIAALVAAADRGVTIKILLDDFGARGLASKDRIRLKHEQISVRYYNPVRWGYNPIKWTARTVWADNMVRDHRKLLIVDGKTVFTGGVGLADEFAPADVLQTGWRETMLEISGAVVADWQILFNHQWQHWGGNKKKLRRLAVKSEPEADLPGRVTISHGIVRQETKRALIQHIRKARHHIWIATAYFVPSWRLRRVLRQAAHRQVDVRLLLPGTITDHPAVRYAGHRFYARLLRAGVRVFELQGRMQHQKVAICDQWVSIGSSNFDRWNLRWNMEANQEVYGEPLSSAVMNMLRRDFENSLEIQYQRWSRRPWHHHWLEYWWGWISRLVSRIGNR